MIKIIKIIGAFLIVVAVLLPIFHFTVEKINEYEYKEVLAEKEETKDYFALLEIKKIGLKREIFNKNSDENNVSKNILLHEKSILPNEKGSYIILAAHSGNGHNAYFKDLYKLEIGDEVNFYYEGKDWSYEIVDIEFQDKTGVLYLKEDFPNMIVLITCTKGDSGTQTVYYGVLNETENL